MKKLSKLLSFVVVCALMIGCISVFAACTPESHTHTFETTWTSDETNHWHKATCEHTTEVSGKAAHTFDPDTNKCTVCGYEKKVEEHVHAFDETKWVNTDPDQHWHPATCGHDTEKGSPAAHTFVGNTCSVCGYTKTVEKTAKCDVYCPVCGKCIDLNCAEDTEKCGDALTNNFTFEAEEAVFGEGARFPEVQNEYQTPDQEEEGAHYVGYLQGNIGASLTFTITANKACVVNLRIRCGCVNDDIFTDSMTTLVNDEIVEAAVLSPKSHKRNFAWVSLGHIALNEGENTIQFIVASVNDGNSAKNMDKSELRAEAGVELTWQYTDNTELTKEEIKADYVTPSKRK